MSQQFVHKKSFYKRSTQIPWFLLQFILPVSIILLCSIQIFAASDNSSVKNMDIVHETTSLFNRAKNLMEDLEIRAEEKCIPIDPYKFKAVASEMRELLKQMIEIQKEINDYNNIKRFMEIVIEVVSEAPAAIPIIAEKLRIAKGTHICW